MRAVVDPNVVISGVLSRDGSPAEVLRRWLAGEFEFVASDALVDELARALAYPKLRKRISEAEADELINLIRRVANLHPDPAEPPSVRSSDSDDDYLIALAEATASVIVSGDGHLLSLAGDVPVFSPAEFLVMLR